MDARVEDRTVKGEDEQTDPEVHGEKPGRPRHERREPPGRPDHRKLGNRQLRGRRPPQERQPQGDGRSDQNPGTEQRTDVERISARVTDEPLLVGCGRPSTAQDNESCHEGNRSRSDDGKHSHERS